MVKPTDNTWNLSNLQDSDSPEESQKILDVVVPKSYEFINKWKDRDDYLKDPKILKEALDEFELWDRKYGTSGSTGYYYGLRSQQESDNVEIKKQLSKIHYTSVKIANDIYFFMHRISLIPIEKQTILLDSKELSDYKHFLEQLFESAKYLLSEKEEKILTLKSKSSHSNWVSMVSEAFFKETAEILNEKGEKEVNTIVGIRSSLSSTNKEVRDSAAKKYFDIQNKHAYIAEHELNAILHNKKVNDELRGMARPDLARHIGDDIDSHVVDTLIDEVSKTNELTHRYYKLKSKLLGVERLETYERNVPIGEMAKKYSYQDSITLVREVFGNLDIEFQKIFDDFVKNNYLDVYPRKGKRDGAFCTSNSKEYPTYVFLNHTDKLQDVLTMAHEMGHGVNDILINRNQNQLNCNTSLAIAEVASTFMEDFVLERLKKDADKKLLLSLNMQKLNEEISTIHRQIACYRFEQDLHREFRDNGYLSGEEISKLHQDRMIEYMGDHVTQTPKSEYGWTTWSHIRRFFYVYSYASGLLISKSLQKMVRENPENINKVKKIFSMGQSQSPENIFSSVGIDINDANFWKQGLGEIEELLNETEKLVM